jgi:hypothetical protein
LCLILEATVEERVMDCFAVLKCNNPKNSCPVVAWVNDSAPVPDAPVSLAFPALRDIRGGSRIITRARRMAALPYLIL